jgi:hypothetical protein
MKFTWKSILGLVASVAGPALAVLTASNGSAHVATAGVASGSLATIGGLIVVGLERLADAKDYATDGGVNVSALTTAYHNAVEQVATVKAQAQSDIAAIKAQAEADVTNARTDVLSQFAKITSENIAVSAPAAPVVGNLGAP